MEIVEEICDRVAIINKGRLIAFDKTERLLSGEGREYYVIKLKRRPDMTILKELPMVGDVEFLQVDDDKDEYLSMSQAHELALHMKPPCFVLVEL